MSDPIYPPPPNVPQPGGPYPGGPAPVNGTNILVMGILSFFCFGIILGPMAWIQGNKALETLNTYGDPTNQRGTVTAGRICGIIGTILSIILIFVRIALIANSMHSR